VKAPEAKARREKIASELAALAKRGRLVPQRVVEWARTHRGSVLHSCFEWSDTKAAEQYRIWQARELIVSVEVVYPDGKARQVYVSPVQARTTREGYHRLVDVMNDADRRSRFLTQALDELERVCSRYEDLCELAGVRAAVRLVRQQKAA
jgi:hypothetical protein